MTGHIVAVCSSERTGEQKTARLEGDLVVGHGLAGDAHAGDWHRQVSLLSTTSVDKMRAKGLRLEPGAFGENFVIDGIAVSTLPIGTRVKLGPEAIVELTQIGKECHERCAIYYAAGDCVMPREGVFAKVLVGGKVRPGDAVSIL